MRQPKTYYLAGRAREEAEPLKTVFAKRDCTAVKHEGDTVAAYIRGVRSQGRPEELTQGRKAQEEIQTGVNICFRAKMWRLVEKDKGMSPNASPARHQVCPILGVLITAASDVRTAPISFANIERVAK